MNSVANLNREELLKRAKELEDLLDASKPKPSDRVKPIRPAAPLKRSAAFPRNKFVLSRSEQPSYFGANSQPKLAPNCRSIARGPLSHNRVYVRKENHGKHAVSNVPDVAPATDSNTSRLAESAASVAAHQSGSRDAESSSLLAKPADSCTAAEKPMTAGRESQLESRDNWTRKHEKLLMFSIGGDDSSDDDDLIRSHHAALRNILHPIKQLISLSHQRKSVVYQSATKLVKINSSSMPKTLTREKLKLHSHPNYSNPRLRSRDTSAESAPSIVASSTRLNRIKVPSNQAATKPSMSGPTGSKSDANMLVSESSKMAHSSGLPIAPSSGSNPANKGSDLKRLTRPENGISTLGSSLKQVLKRTRFKLLKGITVSKRATGPHNKVPKKKGTLKTNTRKHLQTLLMLRGVPFQSSKGGKALKRINTTLSVKGAPSETTMKTRFQAAGSSITRVASQLVNRSVYKLNKRKKNGMMSRVSTSSVSNPEGRKDCIFFIRFGKCHKGDSCKFQHDPKKVSICTKFLRGTCKAEKCPFSHNVDKDRMPLCSYFQLGQCNATKCPYRHSYFRKDIPHCESFLRGFCEKGQQCPKQHVLVCTNLECSRDPKVCPLFHKKKTKGSDAEGVPAKKRKRKTLVVRQKSSLDRDEAWPEFVTLSGSDDEVADVQMAMPSRSSANIKRFLERRTRPVWPDYSKGLSADPIDLRNLTRVNGQLRQTIRKARWLRKVRPIRFLGEYISLDYVRQPESPIIDQSMDHIKIGRRKRRRTRHSRKSSICNSGNSEESSDDDLTVVRAQKERLFEQDDDEDFDPAYRTYGEALQRSKRVRASLGSADSIPSYTTPSDSSDESVIGNYTAVKLIAPNHRDEAPSGSKRIAMNDDDEWLLDYLIHCDPTVSPLPEPERLDFFGPVYEHWEFRTGDRIRETIEKFRGQFRPETSSTKIVTRSSKENDSKDPSEVVDFIPLRDHEEGEILTESEEETAGSGDDLAVVDMELASDDEILAKSVEEHEDEPQHEQEKRDERPNTLRATVGTPSQIFEESSLQFVDDISDLEEGEVL